MAEHTPVHPVQQHPDAGVTFFSRWITGGADRSRAAADALIEQWSSPDTPDALLAQTLFLDVDGSGLLIHTQWTSAEEHLVFARASRTARVNLIDQRVPGIERPGLLRTRLVHSKEFTARGEDGPGLFVFATHEGSHESGYGTDHGSEPHPGLLAEHLYRPLHDNGTVELSEWAGEAAHERAKRPGAVCRTYRFHRALVR